MVPISRGNVVGRWLRARSNDLGYAYCVGARYDEAVLDYTDIPGLASHTAVIAISDLQTPRISRGTRVWLRGNPYGWHCAEVTGWGGSGKYFVRIPSMPRELELPDASFTVRWNRPLTDPLRAVEEGFCDSPEYYEARIAFHNELLRQRRAARGLSAVLSAPVDLFQHQLDTVARVLADPVMRYLLADEVGLGKTIEAGLVIRQLLLDDPSATALVSVPSTLVSQWREELCDRLLLAEPLQNGRLKLMSHGDLVIEPDLRTHAVVVVDEAHGLLPLLDDVPALRTDLWRTRGLLLLSATPMRRNATNLLDLLNLIDPVAFPRDDPAQFEKRVQQREQDATDIQILTSSRASERRRLGVLDNLMGAYGTDPMIEDMINECRRAVATPSPIFADLAQYVRETYQISRRMIRHRRETAATQLYPVTGRNMTLIPFDDPARDVVDDFLEEYRSLPGPSNRSSFAYAVMHALSGPRALLRFLERRLTATEMAAATSGESSLFAATASRLRLSDTETRLRVVAEVVQERLNRDLKVVVFANTAAIANDFYTMAADRWPGRVGRHVEGTDQQMAREEDVSAFLARAGAGVLVGDYTLEEGRNLQDAHVLVNLDLPLDPNRLEQRIGRIDRFARRTAPAEIVVLAEPASDWVTTHIRLLNDGIGIFDRSVATLQRKLAEVFDTIIANIQRDGNRAFATDLESLRAGIAEELIEVDLLEEVESLVVASDFDDLAFADLRRVDSDVDSLRQAFSRLTAMRGGIGLRPREDSQQQTLTFANDARTKLFGLPEDVGTQLRPLLDQRLAYARATTVGRRGVAPLRIGNPLVDWLDWYLRIDERGRARAMIRPGSVAQPALWVGCDFMIEFDATHLAGESEAVRRRLRRRGDAHLPPTIVRTWTNTLGTASEPFIRNVLEKPFDRQQDRILRGPLWKQVLEAMPDWKQRCRLSGEVALDHVRTLPELTVAPAEAARGADNEQRARLAVLRVRSLRLPTPAERESAAQDVSRERSLGQALIQGVQQPMISMVACGAIIVWPAQS